VASSFLCGGLGKSKRQWRAFANALAYQPRTQGLSYFAAGDPQWGDLATEPQRNYPGLRGCWRTSGVTITRNPPWNPAVFRLGGGFSGQGLKH
jgi:hypothetical protein